MTGLVNRHTNLTLQLKASSIFAEVNGFAARVLATLTYFNGCEYDVEGSFIFPQDERTTVVEFEATVEERHVYMQVKDLISSQPEKNVYALEEREDDLFSMSIGSIPPLCSVFVQVTLITELGTDQSSGGSVFVLPSVFTPRLASSEEDEHETTDLYGSQMLIADLPRRTFEPYSFELQLEVAAPCLLAGCSSRTHAIQVDADSRATNASRINVSIAEPHTYDRELEIVLYLSHAYDPYILIEEGKKLPEMMDNVGDQNPPPNLNLELENLTEKAAIMINYTPRLSDTNTKTEFIFLVDRSGSMSGDHIFHVKETLVLALKSLPTDCLFNLIGFGSYYRSLFQESESYSDANLEKACTYIHKMRADLGGTNLLLPLEFIFEKASKLGTPRIVFLMTDGGVSNTVEVVDLVRRNVHTTRFYTFGLGPEACPNLVQGVAGATRGKAYFISEQERMSVKVMEALKHAMQPAITDIDVSWHLPEGYDAIQSPSRVPLVFNRERLVLYGILSRPLGVEKDSPRTPVRRKMDWSMRSFSNNSVKVFWFEDEFEFLADEPHLMEDDEDQNLREDEFADCSAYEDGPFIYPQDSFEAEEPYLDSRETTDGRPLNKAGPVHPDDLTVNSACPASGKSAADRNNFSADHEDGAFEPPDIPNGANDFEWGDVGKKGDFDQSESEVLLEEARGQSTHEHHPRHETETDFGESPKILKFPQRDSGVGFGMEDSDKSPDDKDEDLPEGFLQEDARMTQQGNPKHEALESNSRPPTEGSVIRKDRDTGGELPVRVYKNSKYLEQLGVPSDFGAVTIQGFSGPEEVEQVIPFPVNRSGGSSKRPTIHQLVARSLIRELQASCDLNKVEEIRRISKLSKVHCRHTALVTMDQYCYDDESLSALQFPTDKNSPKMGNRKVLVLERRSGCTSGLGRRLPSPEGSDQESLSETAEGSDNRSLGLGEEPVDFYRLERTGTPESWGEDSESKTGADSPWSQVSRSPKRLPSLSARYVVGERQLNVKGKKKPLASGIFLPLLSNSIKEHLSFVRLATLQSAQGTWALTYSFAGILDLAQHSLLEASPLADGSVCESHELEGLLSSDMCDDSQQLWATALALAWLQRGWPGYQEEWALLAGKADGWLANHPCPRGFTPEDLKTAAHQALLLLDKDKRMAVKKSVAHMTKVCGLGGLGDHTVSPY